jgi:hypothetical protein
MIIVSTKKVVIKLGETQITVIGSVETSGSNTLNEPITGKSGNLF